MPPPLGKAISPGNSPSSTICENSLLVAWNLSTRLPFWREICSNHFILETVDKGYKLPFSVLPEKAILSNNKSALNHSSFVRSEIDNLLLRGCVVKCSSIPHLVNPLSVDQKVASGKLRLILDLRHVNKCLLEFPVKYEGFNELLPYTQKGCYGIEFDLKHGYHHVGIFPEHQEFLGFSWPKDNKLDYYKFRVLPFGLSTACFLFNKVEAFGRKMAFVWNAYCAISRRRNFCPQEQRNFDPTS